MVGLRDGFPVPYDVGLRIGPYNIPLSFHFPLSIFNFQLTCPARLPCAKKFTRPSQMHPRVDNRVW